MGINRRNKQRSVNAAQGSPRSEPDNLSDSRIRQLSDCVSVTSTGNAGKPDAVLVAAIRQKNQTTGQDIFPSLEERDCPMSGSSGDFDARWNEFYIVYAPAMRSIHNPRKTVNIESTSFEW